MKRLVEIRVSYCGRQQSEFNSVLSHCSGHVANSKRAAWRRAVFAKSTEWLVGVVLIALLMGILFAAGGHVWKFYILPGDALVSIVNRCSGDADKSYGFQIAKWRDDHPITASNPHQQERDVNIESCVKADGWCVYSGAGTPGIIGAWGFAPRDAAAKWLYDYRYRAGVHRECF